MQQLQQQLVLNGRSVLDKKEFLSQKPYGVSFFAQQNYRHFFMAWWEQWHFEPLEFHELGHLALQTCLEPWDNRKFLKYSKTRRRIT